MYVTTLLNWTNLWSFSHDCGVATCCNQENKRRNCSANTRVTRRDYQRQEDVCIVHCFDFRRVEETKTNSRKTLRQRVGNVWNNYSIFSAVCILDKLITACRFGNESFEKPYWTCCVPFWPSARGRKTVSDFFTNIFYDYDKDWFKTDVPIGDSKLI